MAIPRAEVVGFGSLVGLGVSLPLPVLSPAPVPVAAGRTGGAGVSTVPAAWITVRKDERVGELGEEVDGVEVNWELDLSCSPVWAWV